MGILEVYVACEHVEDVLLGKVGGRPGFEGSRNIEVPALVFSCDDSHKSVSAVSFIFLLR